MTIPISKRKELRDSYSNYTPRWYYHNTKLAEAIRKWRETNTLKSVK